MTYMRHINSMNFPFHKICSPFDLHDSADATRHARSSTGTLCCRWAVLLAVDVEAPPIVVVPFEQRKRIIGVLVFAAPSRIPSLSLFFSAFLRELKATAAAVSLVAPPTLAPILF